jgi:hypothetical protein
MIEGGGEVENTAGQGEESRADQKAENERENKREESTFRSLVSSASLAPSRSSKSHTFFPKSLHSLRLAPASSNRNWVSA